MESPSVIFLFGGAFRTLLSINTTMIDTFIKAWDNNKSKLESYIKTHPLYESNTYDKLVKLIMEIVVNPYIESIGKQKYNTSAIHEIRDGKCQGTLIYIIPVDTYEPSYWQYVTTFVYYGSCSGCDELLNIIYRENDNSNPNETTTERMMGLCLNILQHFKPLYEHP